MADVKGITVNGAAAVGLMALFTFLSSALFLVEAWVVMILLGSLHTLVPAVPAPGYVLTFVVAFLCHLVAGLWLNRFGVRR